MMNPEPAPVGPRTWKVDCLTTKAPAAVDVVLAVSSLLGVGVSAFRYDNGQFSAGEATLAAALGAGLTVLFLASANAGVQNAEACVEAKEKLAQRDLRRARQQETQKAAEKAAENATDKAAGKAAEKPAEKAAAGQDAVPSAPAPPDLGGTPPAAPNAPDPVPPAPAAPSPPPGP